MKVLALLAAMLLAASALAGCQTAAPSAAAATTEAAGAATATAAPTTAPSEPAAATEPAAQEKITLTYWYPMWANEAEMFTNVGENECYKELEKRTGVHIEFTHPPVAENATAYNTLIASKNLPDIIMHEYYVDYPGGPDKAISDGIYLKLNDLIDQYAPNYKKLIEADPDLVKESRTDAGNIWCFSMIDDRAQEAYMGLVYRQDWLTKLNLQVPTTIDEVYTALQAFKTTMGATAPLLLQKDGVFTSDFALISAFGVNNTFYNENGTVKFGPVQDGYKQYLTLMNKWYKEGLVDQEFPTKTDLAPDITNGRAGMWDDGFWTWDGWKQKATDPNFAMVSGPYPSLNKGEKVHFREQNYRCQQNNTAITTSCKTPEAAVKWLDYKYSEEGFILCNYGIEGKTFTYDADKKPQYTELMTKNPDGLDFFHCEYKYILGKGPYYRKWDREMFSYQKTAVDGTFVWHNSSDGAYVIPPYLTMTPQEGESFNAIMGDITTYVGEQTVKFIIGETPLDDFQKYVDTINGMNLSEALKIKQAAFDRYNAR